MCQHILDINNKDIRHNSDPKTIWTCLKVFKKDGCIKIKKNIEQSQLNATCSSNPKMTSEAEIFHPIMININSLEIYCCECRRELYDSEEQKVEGKQTVDVKRYRAMFIDRWNRGESVAFSSNAEYPPNHQKKGMCGLGSDTLSSYVNSMVQLLANLPSLKQMAVSVDMDKISSTPLSKLLGIISSIWDGQYRIVKTSQLRRELVSSSESMKSYRNKTPQGFFYEVVRWLSLQFSYRELKCTPQEVQHGQFEESETGDHIDTYSPLKQLFGGACVEMWQCQCGFIKQNIRKFECLKLSLESTNSTNFNETDYPVDLMKLIESAFSCKEESKAMICPSCMRIVDLQTYVDMANTLVLEFGVDLDGLNVNLTDQLDLSKFLMRNQSCLYEYLGSISRQNKHYSTHIRKPQTGKEHTCEDEIINQSGKRANIVKIAFYKRTQQTKFASLSRNVNSSIELGVSPVIPIPDFWSIYLNQHHTIQPLMNPFICSHGKIKDNLKQSKMKDGPQRLPLQIYSYLLQTFGGRAVRSKHAEDYCEKCLQKKDAIEQIKQSEKQMATFADRLSNGRARVLIHKDWLSSWKQFLYEQNHKTYASFDHCRPKAINNKLGILSNKVNPQFYKKISSQVWYFLQKFYGGGPLISSKKYQPNIVVVTAVNLRFDAIYHLLQQVSPAHSSEEIVAVAIEERELASQNEGQI